MSGSHFIAQTSKFLLIDAIAVTFGQGHGNVIEYISPDPYILSAKYVGLAQLFSSERQKLLPGLLIIVLDIAEHHGSTGSN